MSEFLSLSPDSPETDQAVSEPAHFAGFWRRLAAFVIDCILIGIVGFCVGMVFYDALAELGVWGRLLGFTIALIYFGVLNSCLGNGQTLGKRFLNIKVVGRDGIPIPLPRSLLRYVIIGVPFFLNGALIPISSSLLTLGLSVIIFAVAFAIIYLFIFNRQTRQSLHDLAAESFVVRGTHVEPPPAVVIWKYHLLIATAAAVLFLGVGIVTTYVVGERFGLADLLIVQERIHESGKVHFGSVFVGTFWGPEGAIEYLSVNAIMNERPVSYEDSAKEIAAIVLDSYPDITSKDLLDVTVTYGFDIGISSGWQAYRVSHTPQEWSEILKQPTEEINEQK